MRRHDPDKLAEFLEDQGFEPVASRSDEYASSDCPLCHSRSKEGRVMVNVDSGYVNCWSCGGWRNVIRWVMEVDGVSFTEAKALVGAGDEEAHARSDLIHSIFEEPIWQGLTWPTLDLTGVEWLSPEGNSPAASRAAEAVVTRGFPFEWLLLKRVGYGHVGKYSYNRVVLPVYFQGRLVWWQAWDWTKQSEAKYLGLPADPTVLGRRHIFYQWDLYGGSKTLVICEGVYNAWAVEQVGWPAIAAFGKSFSPQQLALIVASPVEEFVLAHDADARADAARLASDLTALGRRARLVSYPDAHRDMNDLAPEERVAVLQGASQPDWFLDHVARP